MRIPSNMTQEMVLQEIEKVVHILSPNFKFAYFDLEDTKQEARMMALEALDNFNENIGIELSTFLYTHIRNRLLNLHRDKMFRKQPKNYNKDNKNWDKWEKRNQDKKNILNPVNIEDCSKDITYESDVQDLIDIKEIIKVIDENININMRADFLRLKEGSKIPSTRKERLIEHIKSIIYEHFGENFNEESWTNI